MYVTDVVAIFHSLISALLVSRQRAGEISALRTLSCMTTGRIRRSSSPSASSGCCRPAPRGSRHPSLRKCQLAEVEITCGHRSISVHLAEMTTH